MRKLLLRICVTLGLFVAVLPAAQAETLRVTVLGDSLVQGYGLPQGEGLVPQLQAWLAAQGADVMLTNAGVSGDTTAGGVSRIDWTLADQPQGLIVLLGGNDLLRGLPPVETRANLEEIVTRAQAADVGVMLIGMQAPLNYGAEFKSEFDSIYTDLAEEYGLILHPSAFLGISNEVGEDLAAAGPYMQADRIHPNAAGVALNVAAMGEAVLQFLERVAKAN